jgi:hypothetical protein
VHVELLDHGQVLESAEEVGRYRAAFDQARKRALSPEESLSFLSELAKEYR